MSKFLNAEAQKPHKKRKGKKKHSFIWFLLGMILYAAVFLTGAYYGLKQLWIYMEAYEGSRPDNTVNAYMDALTEDHIVEMGLGVIDQIDLNIQSEDECRAYIREAISGGVTHAKKTKECTDTRQVYVLRTGTQVIGEFSIEAQEPDAFGFTPWVTAGESFDFSYLIGTTVSMTVPHDHAVLVNGHQLGSEYVIEDKIIYEEIKDLYEDYDMPYRVTYEAGPFLGNLEMTAMDPSGNPVTFDEDTDWSQFYHNCTEEEAKALDEFTAEYVKRYVAFTGSSKNTRHKTLAAVLEYMVSGSDLEKRMRDALDGLQFGQSKGDEVVSIVTHHQIKLEEGKYLCDVTYEVDTTGKKGVVRTSTNAKYIIVETSGGLKLDSMSIY